MPFRTLVALMLCMLAEHGFSQIVINEVASTGAILSATGDESDWIELYNTSATAVSLDGLSLTDDPIFPNKWPLPATTLGGHEHFLVLANGGNTYANTDHWETAMVNEAVRKYFIGISEPPSDWNTIGFNDASWSSGAGGIGFGDGDDNTTIGSARSVYMRCAFTIDDVSIIEDAKLHMDYDDAFVAYLNGVEIARSGNIIGTPPAYNTLANSDHEAGMYAGYPAEEWNIPAWALDLLLVNGTNVLSIQVHNVTVASSDMSSNAWLSFGINTPGTYFSPVPAWFYAPFAYNETNFKITNTGETIYLYDASGASVDMVYAIGTDLGHSYARSVDGGGAWCVTTSPTPDISNDGMSCFLGYEPVPDFSLEPGFYTGTQVVTITSTSPTAEIHYTTDGSLVTAASPVYISPVTVAANAVISARCYSTTDKLPGAQKKNTYFINEDTYTLPILSISIDPSSLFDYDTGIYEFGCCYDVNYPYYGANFWQPWERYGHIAYFTPEGNMEWEKNMSLEIHGGWSRAEAQRGFRVDFKNKYGGDLTYPLFGGKPDLGPINNFNIRSGGQHVWTYKLQDAFLAKVMQFTHIDYEEWQPCMLFINGQPWGLYEIREKADEHFAESNYGDNNNDVDLLNAWTVLSGSDTGWWNMYSGLFALDPTSDAFYDFFDGYMDIENYIDYYIGQIYYQNVDFGGYYWGANNMKVWRNRNGGKWRFIMYDMDGAMGYFGSSPYDNYIDLTRSPGSPSSYSQIFDRVMDNQDIREYFVNRFADLINTIYQPDNMESVLYAMRDSILGEIPHQVERWGAPNVSTVNAYVADVLSYNNLRKNAARTHINTSFALDGQRSLTLEVSPAGAGYIKLNTIVPTDLPWTGIYFDGVPVTMTAVANPGYTFSNWAINDLLPAGSTDISLLINLSESETFTAVFNGAAVMPDIVVTEINYNSHTDYPSDDWLELYNNSGIALDISYWILRDRYDVNTFVLPAGSIMNPGERLVIAKDPVAFSAVHPGVDAVVGGFAFELDNSGDDIRLFSIDEELILSMTYADSSSWPEGADGNGRTLELSGLAAILNDPASWFDGCLGGSPGEAYAPCTTALLFGEINYHSADATNAGDWVELWNTGMASIDISGWRFVNAEDTLLFTFPTGTSLNPDERLVICSDADLFAARHPDVANVIGEFAFTLDNSGDALRLFDDQSVLQFSMQYEDGSPWPVEADGGGKTLELVNPYNPINNASNWIAGCPEGSPGMVYDPDCDGQILVENLLPENVIIYPNPADDYVVIELATPLTYTDRLVISDMSGRVWQVVSSPGNDRITVLREGAPAGVYQTSLIRADGKTDVLFIWGE